METRNPKSRASASSATSAKKRSGSLASNARSAKQNLEDDLPELLLRCRTERGLTLDVVAQAVHLNAMTISNIERRMVTPHRANRLRIAMFLRDHGYFPKEA